MTPGAPASPSTRRAKRLANRLLSRRVDDERGAVLPMTALLMVVIIGFTAFAADLGLQRVAARDMQAVADVVALDTARALPTCDTGVLTAAANKSLARQDDRIGDADPLVITPGHLGPAPTRTFVAGASGSGTCDAVQIKARTTVDYAFAPVIGKDTGSAQRVAIGARAEPAVCFSAGTKALVLNSSQSALGPLLDKILRVNLGVVGYSGLVDLKDLSVPLADLAAALNVGGVDGLANANVTLQQLLVANAKVLRDQGKLAQATLLESIGAQVSTPTFALGKILAVNPTDTAALNASVNALDLVGTAIVEASIANGKNAVALGADLGLPLDLLNASSRITIIEPPQIACGRTGAQAKTAQVRVDLKTAVSVGGLLRAADLDLGVRVASGTATLGALTCAATPTVTVTGQTSATSISRSGGSGDAQLDIVSLLGIRLAGIDLKGSVASSTSSYTFTYPAAPALPPTHTFGSPLNLNLEIANTTLLGLLLSPVTSLLTTILNPLLQGLLTPLLSLLGIKLGTMDVTMLGRPSCAGVKLAG